MNKKEKIIKIAIKEFSEKGFEAASTNKIAQEAKVSKGIVFHYFKNKENLFFETYKWSQNFIGNIFLDLYESTKEEDFFNFLKLWIQKKIEIIKKYPEVFNLFFIAQNLPEQLKLKILSETQNSLQEKYFVILKEKLSKLNLRKNIDPEEAFNFIILVFNCFSNNYLNHSQKLEDLIENSNSLLKQIDKIIEMIKFGILQQ
ncbi:MAG: helix-turn-helix transcriptional regulator [Thermosipho sp. (in: Bacteria)]|nr:helix-turn-helix transcriptional regulator [Thermosipho sp. (in: thermotogales)]